MAFEIGEIISLAIALIGYVILSFQYKTNKNLFTLFVAYTLLLIGTITTVVEGYYLASSLNFIEHLLGSAAAGIAFMIVAWVSGKSISDTKTNVNNKMVGRK